MLYRSVCFALAALGLAACKPGLASVAPSEATSQPPAPPHAAELIYRGEVFAQGHEAPTCTYERRVTHGGPEHTSTHRTYAPDGATPIVDQRAVHSARYRLHEFEEVHHQTGMTSAVQVRADGSLEFMRSKGRRVRTRSEGPGAPVVVGPTLFGVVREHFTELARGETIEIRFAVPERLRSYVFTLRRSKADATTTTIEMVAQSPFVRRSVGPMTMVFQTDDKTIVRYTGRVPPRLRGNRPMNARVEYTQVAASYR